MNCWRKQPRARHKRTPHTLNHCHQRFATSVFRCACPPLDFLTFLSILLLYEIVMTWCVSHRSHAGSRLSYVEVLPMIPVLTTWRRAVLLPVMLIVATGCAQPVVQGHSSQEYLGIGIVSGTLGGHETFGLPSTSRYLLENIGSSRSHNTRSSSITHPGLLISHG